GSTARRDDRGPAGAKDGRGGLDWRRRVGCRAGGSVGVKIAVVGLGHIGLPLAVQYATRGHVVVGADINPRIVDFVNRGESPHLDEPALIEGVPRVVTAGNLRATYST